MFTDVVTIVAIRNLVRFFFLFFHFLFIFLGGVFVLSSFRAFLKKERVGNSPTRGSHHQFENGHEKKKEKPEPETSIHACAPLYPSTPHFAVLPLPITPNNPWSFHPIGSAPTQSYHRSRSSLSRPPPLTPEAVFVVTFLLLLFFHPNPIQPDVNPTTPPHTHIRSPSKNTLCRIRFLAR